MSTSRLFYLAWALTAGLIAGSLPWLPDRVGDPGSDLDRAGYLVSMLLPLASAGLCSKAFVGWIGRLAPGQVNLPHRDYWMAEPRREATLERLGEAVSGIGLLVLALLAGVHLQLLLAAHPGWPQPPHLVWGLGGAALLAGLAAWCWQVRRLFPAPPTTEPTPQRRPRRPGEAP